MKKKFPQLEVKEVTKIMLLFRTKLLVTFLIQIKSLDV